MLKPGSYILKNKLNVRSSPNTVAVRIGVITPDLKFEVVTEPYVKEGIYTWQKIVWGNEFGWIATESTNSAFNPDFYDLRYHDMWLYVAGVSDGGKSKTHLQAGQGIADQQIQVHRSGGRVLHVKGGTDESAGWESLFVKDNWIWRDVDTSHGYRSLYTVNDGNGAKWIPRFWKPGQSVRFSGKIDYRYYDGRDYDKVRDGQLIDTIHFVAIRENFSLVEGGIEFPFVAEIKNHADTFYYAPGNGLVGWESNVAQQDGIQAGTKSYAVEYRDSQLVPIEIEWLKPFMKDVPNPESIEPYTPEVETPVVEVPVVSLPPAPEPVIEPVPEPEPDKPISDPEPVLEEDWSDILTEDEKQFYDQVVDLIVNKRGYMSPFFDTAYSLIFKMGEKLETLQESA